MLEICMLFVSHLTLFDLFLFCFLPILCVLDRTFCPDSIFVTRDYYDDKLVTCGRGLCTFFIEKAPLHYSFNGNGFDCLNKGGIKVSAKPFKGASLRALNRKATLLCPIRSQTCRGSFIKTLITSNNVQRQM